MRWLYWFSLLFALQAVPGHALEPIAVTQDVYAFLGSTDEPSPENAGNTGNAGFIIAEHGVIVVDTGASYRQGRAMVEAIRRITAKPIALVILTHAVQDFVFGAAAFTEIGAPLLAHRRSSELMRERCEHCLENLQRLLGEDAMFGTRLVIPSMLIEASSVMQVAGRDLELLHFGWGATPGDLVVFDRRSGVLFAGGLVSNARIPELRDGQLHEWAAVLERLARLPVHHLVPGHGPVADVHAATRTRSYLLELDRLVHRLYAQRRSLLEAVDEAQLPAYRDWGGYPGIHRRNVQQRYLELEVADMEAF